MAEFASNAKGNLGVTLGAIGTGLSALGSSGILNGITGSNTYVSQDVFDLQTKLIDEQKKTAILEADLNTETKIVEAYKASVERENAIRDELNGRITDLSTKVDSNASAQAVINAQFGSNIALNTSQIGQLFTLTKMVIPSTNVCTASTTTVTA